MEGNAEVKDYRALIHEAFIDPIRSVLIIDDDYPTWDEILNPRRFEQAALERKQPTSGAKAWITEPHSVLDIVQNFRNKKPALLVDIHDGTEEGDPQGHELAAHLHQSDLLVLDYQLEGTRSDGKKARGIVRKLLSNDHFNLIVVHTASDDLLVPFNEMLLSLMMKCPRSEAIERSIEEANDILEEYDDDNPENNIIGRLRELFGYEQYFSMRHPLPLEKANRLLSRGNPPFTEIKAFLDTAKLDGRHHSKILLKLFRDFEDRHTSDFSPVENPELTWTHNKKCLWLRTDRGFVAFSKKGQVVDLMNTLEDAIKDWRPSPTRLLSAKFRSELENRGVSIEDKALSNRHVHAKFYSLVLEGNIDTRRALIDALFDRYTEQITGEVKDKVREFGLAIVNADTAPKDSDNSFSTHYGVNLSLKSDSEKATDHYNSHISIKMVAGWHLTCGHILAIGDERWVCLSPACDMSPGQRVVGISAGETGNLRPFIAVQLHRRKPIRGNLVQSNNFLFLPEGDGITPYSFYGSGDESSEATVLPIWKMFLAREDGKFLAADEPTKRISVTWFKSETGDIEYCTAEADVVAQLRYEYALNLLHKLGASMTRIGLDFQSHA